MANLTDIYKKASLVMKPAAMKEGKLYSQQPHSGAGDFTFSRANGVQTRINEHGLIETVADNTPRLSYDLVTKEDSRTNYATNSESIHNYSNVGGSSPNPTLTASYTEAPDGSPTATRLQATVTGSSYSLIQFPSTADGDGTYYISVYAKSNTEDNQTISFYGNGTTTTAHTVTPEWTRITVEATRGAGITKYAFLGTWPNNHGTDSSIDISLWGAQIEVNVEQASDYIPTGDEPVTIPAVVVASECPTLLLEPTRTNIITQSRELTSGDLAKANLTVSDNANIVDPTGKKNTKTITATSASQPRLEWRGTSVPSSNTNYAMSFFVRYNTARYVAIGHFSQTGEYAIFDLVDGVVEADTGTQTAKIEAYPNGWYRVSKTFEVLSTASLNYWKFTLCTQTNPFVGVSGEEADVFGLQFEASDYPTSYIPTEGSTGVRNADTAKLSNFSEIPSDNPFTVLWEGSADTYDSTGFSSQSPFSLVHSGAFNCYFSFNFVDENTMAIRRRNTSDTNNTFSVSNSDNYKIAVCYINSTTIKVYVNGVEAANSTAFSSVSFTGGEIVDTILIGQLRDGADTGKRNSCKNFALFNEELSSSELITLTK